MSYSIAEYVGGPLDGDTAGYAHLPSQILIPGRAENFYQAAISGEEISISEPTHQLEGVYRFDRLTWAFPYPKSGSALPVTAGLYVWEGYR